MANKPMVLVMRDSGMNGEELLEQKLSTDWSIVVMSSREDTKTFYELASKVDVVVGGPMPKGIPDNKNLKLYQAPFTGHDWISPEDLPCNAVFCNTFEHETAIAEYLLAGMLEWQIGLIRETHPMMKERSYNGRSINHGPHHLEMRGSTVGIIGYGHIGREVARRCKAFDMKVMAVSRTRRDEGALVDWYGNITQLEVLLRECDFVINCAPGGKATRGMIGAEAFAIMKSNAVIANVGRGEVIDEAALYDALSSRRIRGAIIDVWYVYPSSTDPNPWPSKFPFQKLDNIIMSPHNSAWTNEMSHRRWNFVASNLDRLARRESLLNICFKGLRNN